MIKSDFNTYQANDQNDSNNDTNTNTMKITRIKVLATNDITTNATQVLIPSDSKRRRLAEVHNSQYFTVYNLSESSLEDVGKQIWAGSMLLADLLLFQQANTGNEVVCELGCGCGLLGVILMSYTHPANLYLTDYETCILDLAERNYHVNAHIFSDINSDPSCQARFRLLDWSTYANNCSYTSGNTSSSSSAPSKYEWTEQDQALFDNNRIIYLAADVIYDDELTVSFFTMLHQRMKYNDILYLSLEKRVNFELIYMSVVAHSYHTFLDYIHDITDTPYTAYTPHASYTPYTPAIGGDKVFVGRRIPLHTIPQRVASYTRSDEYMELWQIERRRV